MIKFFTKRMNNRKGFTLIELIVVIAILGILAAIAIPRFTGLRQEATLKAEVATANSIISAIRIQEAETGYIVKGDVTNGTPDGTDLTKLDVKYMLLPTDTAGVTTFTVSGKDDASSAGFYTITWTSKAGTKKQQSVTEGSTFTGTP